MTAPDPGLTDLIATHLTELIADAPEEDNYDAGYVAALADLRDSAAFKLVVEQHTNGRITELEAENVRLRAQVASIGHVHPGTCSPVETHPDDREINEAIDESECFADAMFEIAEKYGANVTNNMDRWQDGVFLRHIAEFIEDTETAALKHLRAALEGEQQ